MNKYLVEINPWERIVCSDESGFNIKVGDYIIAETEFGEDFGKVLEIKNENTESNGSIKRLADKDDQKHNRAIEKERSKAISECRQVVNNYALEMKIVDCHFSFDGQRLSFAFIADGRIDFRELVKDLNRRFNKIIRLHQIGVRDEAKLLGDIGCCGEEQCCRSHLKKLGNVTSEFAEDQQIIHRGSERLSGICGRLKCCLAYEEPVYQEIIKKLPAIGIKVKTEHGRGTVVGWHVLRCSVDVQLDKDRPEDKSVIVEIPIKK